jgi:hypothetical protein
MTYTQENHVSVNHTILDPDLFHNDVYSGELSWFSTYVDHIQIGYNINNYLHWVAANHVYVRTIFFSWNYCSRWRESKCLISCKSYLWHAESLSSCRFCNVAVQFCDLLRNVYVGTGKRPRACWDCGFESCQGHRCLCMLSVVRERTLRRTDHSSREVLPTAMHHCVWSRNLKNEEALAHVGLQRHRGWKKKKHACIHTYVRTAPKLYYLVITSYINLKSRH